MNLDKSVRKDHIVNKTTKDTQGIRLYIILLAIAVDNCLHSVRTGGNL